MKGLQWLAQPVGDSLVHVMPLGDLRDHSAEIGCWCHPTPDEDSEAVIVHHSADQREAFERGERKPS